MCGWCVISVGFGVVGIIWVVYIMGGNIVASWCVVCCVLRGVWLLHRCFVAYKRINLCLVGVVVWLCSG